MCFEAPTVFKTLYVFRASVVFEAPGVFKAPFVCKVLNVFEALEQHFRPPSGRRSFTFKRLAAAPTARLGGTFERPVAAKGRLSSAFKRPVAPKGCV